MEESLAKGRKLPWKGTTLCGSKRRRFWEGSGRQEESMLGLAVDGGPQKTFRVVTVLCRSL